MENLTNEVEGCNLFNFAKGRLRGDKIALLRDKHHKGTDLFKLKNNVGTRTNRYRLTLENFVLDVKRILLSINKVFFKQSQTSCKDDHCTPALEAKGFASRSEDR